MDKVLIAGDLSGIQDYLFRVANRHGGQARRLRARSFFLQAITEAAILRLSRVSSNVSLLWCAAGRFVLQSDEPKSPDTFNTEYSAICEWLRQETGSALRFAAVVIPASGGPAEQSNGIFQALRREKARPLSALVSDGGRWRSEIMMLPSISPACEICGSARASRLTEEGVDACDRCIRDEFVGRELPAAGWLAAHTTTVSGSIDVLGIPFTLHDDFPTESPTRAALFALGVGSAPPNCAVPITRRRLSQHIPIAHGRPLDFDAIAEQARGAPYLGVLKMDADSLGQAFSKVLAGAKDWTPYQMLSDRLDRFFGEHLSTEIKKPAWNGLYVIYAGGDDMLIVGPWNVTFDFAGHVRREFDSEFGRDGLTISAAIAMAPAKHPIRRAAVQAEELLETAKSGTKDQCAVFGQVWKWSEHEAICHWAKCLSQWVESDTAQRGWLQTLMRLIEQRASEPAAEARLAYHVGRNYPRADSRDAQQAALRAWADQLARDFTDQRSVQSRYLPAIVQYALTATRSEAGGEMK